MSAAGVPPAVSILEAHGGSIKGMHFEARSVDPSTVADASTPASLLNLRKELSLLPPSRGDEDEQQGSVMPTVPSACELSDNHVEDVDMKDASDHDGLGVSFGEKTGVPSPEDGNENLNVDSGALDSADLDTEKVSRGARELGPLLRRFAGSSGPDFDSILKILDEQREIKELLKDINPPILISTRHQAFKEELQHGVVDPSNIEVSFETFPYYLRFGHA